MKRLLALLLTSLPLLCSGQATSIFDYGSEWKYLLGVAEASSPDPTAWRAPDFIETGWSSGQAPLGYANPANSAAEFNLVTLLPSVQEGNYLSVFLRKKFTVSNPAQVSQLTLNVNIDDGFIAWINTNMVMRYNVPDGELPYNGTAISAIEPTLVSTNITENVAALLLPGENVLAVQVFNANNTSSDMFFDASMASDLDQTPPAVIDTTPLPGGIVRELRTIDVVFSENIQGVDRADLRINGVSASDLNVISPREYAFSFPQPATGQVQVAWASNHGITDAAPTPNPFAGGSWSYTLDPARPLASIVISEFMADNQNGIRDENGTRSDWIELLNLGTESVNLGGCFLTDSTNNLTKWQLPAIYLDPKEYLLIWASAKDRTNATGQLHGNFKLAKDGSYLALIGPATNVLSDFFPAYPAQQPDASYGRSVGDPEITGYFAIPTPGAQNSTSGTGFAPEPIFSREGGVITNASVTVSLSTPAGQIRYTLDGSAPTNTSALYSSPLNLATTTTIKARVFQAGLFPSAIIAKAYVVVDGTVANFKSKLPVMIISTSGQGIANHVPSGQPRTFASVLAVDTVRGLCSPLSEPNYLGQAEIGVRGQTSSGFPKQPYRLELQDAYRNDRDANLLGLSSGADWILNNPYTDKPFLQNFLAQELFEKMGHYAVRRRFVEVFVNTQSGRVSYPRDYAGIYLLLEKIKVGDDRVPIEPLTPYDTAEPNISGGYMFKKDKDSAGDLNFSTLGGAGFSGQSLKVHEPSPTQITSPQYNWLVNYLRQFEKALYASNWKTATGTNHYSYYIDVASFVDQHWIVEYTKQIDGYRLSNYMQKDRNGKVKMEPIWDWNLSFGNADYLEGYNTTGWYHALLGDNEFIWLRRLMSGTTAAGGTTGDPDFNQRIADRWSELRTNILATTNVLARVNELTNLLSEAADRDFQKWPRLGTYVWPNPGFYVTPTTYGGIIVAMKNWIQGRYNWIDKQFVLAPTVSPPGGRVPPGFNVTISGSASVYYTVDGSDPRAPGGAISTNALLYSGPVSLTNNARVVARVRSGTRWSGPAGSTFVVAPTPLLVTEIMYHPAPPPIGSLFPVEDFEYLELMNSGNTPLEMRGFQIGAGVDFAFPPYTLNPGARVLVVKSMAAFESRYGLGLPIAGEYLGQLDNAGQRITGTTALGEVVFDLSYEDDWWPITDGPGFSLVLNDESISPNQLAAESSWRAGSAFNGSPSHPKPAPLSFPRVVVNEALTRTDASRSTQVELQNLSSASADVSGWFLTDNFDKPAKFRIPDRTVIPAGKFVVFSGSDFSQSQQALVPFRLNPLGEEIYLFSGGTQTNLTGYVHGFTYGAQRTNVTFGRYVNSQNKEFFVTQIADTVSGTNSLPLVPPVVISEIMYRPADVFTNGAFWNNTEGEYIELYNRSDLPVDLYDASHPTNGWKISGTVDFTFPPGTTVPAKGYVLVVNFDPVLNPTQLAAFRQNYNVPAQAPILGPYEGSLDNRAGKVNLSMPESPQLDGTVPSILAEQVHYSDATPWPSGADGLGYALCRLESAQFGNDPVNWVAAPPTAGAPHKLGPLPVIVRQPSSQLVLVSQTVTLSVLAQGQAPLTFQWRFNGQNLEGAVEATLVLTNAQPSQSGEYALVVMDSNGATTSEAASVLVGEDHDGDGMEDNWEFDYGLNPYDAADAAQDPDGDSLSNLSEYIAGTDPLDSASYLRIQQISSTGQEATLSFRAVANRSYTVQYTDQLNPLAWLKLGDVDPRSTDFVATIVDPAAKGSRYYRLVTPAKP